LSLIDRTFVCIGRDKHDEYFNSWVMTIDEHLDVIYFWEPYSGKIYCLREGMTQDERRISDKSELRKCLNYTKVDEYMQRIEISCILKDDHKKNDTDA